jgi:hypothetical protein
MEVVKLITFSIVVILIMVLLSKWAVRARDRADEKRYQDMKKHKLPRHRRK